jgi:hypothetical protein
VAAEAAEMPVQMQRVLDLMVDTLSYGAHRIPTRTAAAPFQEVVLVEILVHHLLAQHRVQSHWVVVDTGADVEAITAAAAAAPAVEVVSSTTRALAHPFLLDQSPVVLVLHQLSLEA